ncbi:hypothetical protein M426DRAFT_258715 [Hypoxylon sp. CI-4A]|nr:hypothetical protein M426DRAFT_258715 [Hypoxylon sp. CI-4A]
MDHLPAPLGTRKRPSVAFYARSDITYTPSDFVAIPAGEGYNDIDQLAEHGIHYMDVKKANAFLQEWLFFSLLACVLDEDINAADFLDRSSYSVQTKLLNKKLAGWKKREQDDAKQQNPLSQARYVIGTDALSIAQRFVSKHLSYKSRAADDGRPIKSSDSILPAQTKATVHDAIDSKLALSIAILGEILQRERPEPQGCSMDEYISIRRDPCPESRQWGYSRYCRQQLEQNNWCPTEILRLESTMPGQCEVYFASSARRLGDHSDCNWKECRAPPLEPLGHVEGECDGNCNGIGLDSREVERIIDSGSTPLVTYSQGELHMHEVDLASQSIGHFGAISHSWEDTSLTIAQDARGGNDRRVYECFLHKMQQDFNKLAEREGCPFKDGDIPFYLDALCYPRQVDIQQTALNQMRLIYSKAKAVLVLDRTLLGERKLSASKVIEMNVKIRIGSWTKSLWTLLEGVLSSTRTIAIAFSDDILTFSELEFAQQEAQNNLFHEYHHIYQAGHPFSEAIYRLHKLETSETPTNRPQKAFNAVQFQIIDRAENEAPILAALMGVDAAKLAVGRCRQRGDGLVRTKNQEWAASMRMVKLLEAMDDTPGLGIPSGLIFLPPPYLRNDKFPETAQYGWAPRTWLARQAHPRSLREPLRTIARRHPKGLIVHYPGLDVRCVSPLKDTKFWVPVSNALYTWFKVTVYPPVEDSASWLQTHVGSADRLVIILSRESPCKKGIIGLLVKPKGFLSDNEVQWVDRLCQVWVRLEVDKSRIRDLSNSFRQHRDRVFISACLPEQEWCVDGAAD